MSCSGGGARTSRAHPVSGGRPTTFGGKMAVKRVLG